MFYRDTLIPGVLRDLRLPAARATSRRATRRAADRPHARSRRPGRVSAEAPRDGCSGHGWSATTTRRRVRASGGSSRSRRISDRTTTPRTPASGARTATPSCSGPPAIAYVYLVYGMYDCLNVVTGRGRHGRRRAHPRRRAARRRRGDAREIGSPCARRRRAVREDVRPSPSPRDRARARAAATAGERPGTGRRRVRPGPDVDRRRTCATRPAPSDWKRDSADRRIGVPPDGPIRATPRIGVDYAGPDWADRPLRFTRARAIPR